MSDNLLSYIVKDIEKIEFASKDIRGTYKKLTGPWMSMVIAGGIHNINVSDVSLDVSRAMAIHQHDASIDGNIHYKLIEDISENLSRPDASQAIQAADQIHYTDDFGRINYDTSLELLKDTSVTWDIQLLAIPLPGHPIIVDLSYSTLQLDISHIVFDTTHTSQIVTIRNTSYYPSTITLSVSSSIVNYHQLAISDVRIRDPKAYIGLDTSNERIDSSGYYYIDGKGGQDTVVLQSLFQDYDISYNHVEQTYTFHISK